MHKTTIKALKSRSELQLSCDSCKFSGAAKPHQQDILTAEGRLHEQRVNR